jgi:hypothetical protein
VSGWTVATPVEPVAAEGIEALSPPKPGTRATKKQFEAARNVAVELVRAGVVGPGPYRATLSGQPNPAEGSGQIKSVSVTVSEATLTEPVKPEEQ